MKLPIFANDGKATQIGEIEIKTLRDTEGNLFGIKDKRIFSIFLKRFLMRHYNKRKKNLKNRV